MDLEQTCEAGRYSWVGGCALVLVYPELGVAAGKMNATSKRRHPLSAKRASGRRMGERCEVVEVFRVKREHMCI